jgi:hypothetical protein
MVCFDVEIAYPLNKRTNVNQTFERRIEHLRRHHRGDILCQSFQGNLKHIRLAFCDEDTIAFLRDVPQPTFCVKIKLLRSDLFLYSNFKYTNTWVKPPKHLLLKKIYWTASSLEKWQILDNPESRHMSL